MGVLIVRVFISLLMISAFSDRMWGIAVAGAISLVFSLDVVVQKLRKDFGINYEVGVKSLLVIFFFSGLIFSIPFHEKKSADAGGKASEENKSVAKNDSVKAKSGDSEFDAEIFLRSNFESKVQSLLKDPDSAKFSEVRYVRNQSGVFVACGYVNAKNGFGGYKGKERFVTNGMEVTVLESMVSDFESLWGNLCSG